MFECGYCELEFKNQEDADHHMDQNDHWWDCDWCEKTFRTATAANAHKVARNHLDSEFECLRCEREFNSQNALDQHMNALGHWPPPSKHKCETCDETFVEKRTAREHMDYWEHWKGLRFECQSCDRTFSSQQGADKHMDDLDHWTPTVECETCDRMFFTEESAEQHMRAKKHHKKLLPKSKPVAQSAQLLTPQAQVEQPQTSHDTAVEVQSEGLKQIEIIRKAKESAENSTAMSEKAAAMLQKATAMMEEAAAMMEKMKGQNSQIANRKENQNTPNLPKSQSIQAGATSEEQASSTYTKQASHADGTGAKSLHAEDIQVITQIKSKDMTPQALSVPSEKPSTQRHNNGDSQGTICENGSQPDFEVSSFVSNTSPNRSFMCLLTNARIHTVHDAPIRW